MNGFEFQAKTKVAFGIGRSNQIADDVKALSRTYKVVLVTDPGLVQLGVPEPILRALHDGGIEAHLFSDVQSDPSSTSIDQAAAMIRESGADCVIGLGGGSAMDVAKMAALVAGDVHPAEHYALMAHSFQPKQVKSIMIPTTSGTGAEVTSTVVFSTTEKRKVWGWDADMGPDLAVLDPTLTALLPPHLTAATGLDAIVHAIEAVAGKRSNAMIRALSLEAIRLLGQSLLIAVKEPANLQARGDLSLGAMLAGMAIEQGGTGIAHCIGHALGTLGRVHHGRAVAIALYDTYDWNIEANVPAHADIARALGVIDQGQDDLALAGAGAARFRQLVEASGLQLSLAGEGLSAADADRFAEIMQAEENAPMRNNNCRASSASELQQFAHHILSR
ncbi:iron-containing alcohol dehydrogenase [Paenibacillus alginolyticus]|uniref:Iron-containing alcohol dehydrogenase n=1 Tax=Paenibacillus alginolyticus TaxID=59839 RepID=A0ABT4G777_9BACL|nr:iron-containing alcohol dehydrogenase [Paenibacillus alginolyticus]MCY9692030.1 iron-containing alcohol dehydrogenase [Paenibacillus alginolyticus]MEC0144220.1 iron-containing alcohol dehydrogenase [Paenibacillus alginolyticus]